MIIYINYKYNFSPNNHCSLFNVEKARKHNVHKNRVPRVQRVYTLDNFMHTMRIVLLKCVNTIMYTLVFSICEYYIPRFLQRLRLLFENTAFNVCGYLW